MAPVELLILVISLVLLGYWLAQSCWLLLGEPNGPDRQFEQKLLR